MEEDEGDKFLMGLEGAVLGEEESFLDIKKRQEQRKDLKRVDHSLQN